SMLIILHLFISSVLFLFNHPATPAIYTLSLHDALPILLFPVAALGLALAVSRKEALGSPLSALGRDNDSPAFTGPRAESREPRADRKSTRLNSSHQIISYAVFCLKKKTKENKTESSISR